MTPETTSPETIEEIATRIVDEQLDEMMSPREYGSTRRLLINDFVKALRDRDERAIQIINRFSVCRDHDQPTHCVQCDLRHKAIAAVRKGK